MSFFLHLSKPSASYIDGNMEYLGNNLIINTKNAFWFNKKYLVEESVFVKNYSSTLLFCDEYKLSILEYSDVSSNGINEKVSCLSKWKTYKAENIFSDINKELASRYDSFSSNQAEILKGITLGIKPDKDLYKEFQQTGLAHIVVISGFNITLILTVVSILLSKLKNLFKVILVIIIIVGFILIVGLTPPVIRAAIMGILGFLSTTRWRNVSYVRLLLFASLAMIILDPYVVYSVSFHLSVIATYGVIIFSSNINTKLLKIPRILREPFSQSLAANVFTIPYSINIFNTFSSATFITNILILPVVGIYSIIAYIYLFLPSSVLKFILELISNYILYVVQGFSNYENAQTILNTFQRLYINLGFSLLFFIFLVFYIYHKLHLFYRIAKKTDIQYYSKG